MKVKAKKINNPNCDYLTEGKEYPVINDEPLLFKTDRFVIRDDNDRPKACSFKNCKHIKGNWTIITDKAKVR